MTTAPGTSAELTDSIRAFLEMPRYAVIATINPDGSPHQAPIWYGLTDDGEILVNSRMGRRWPGNLQRDARVSLAIVDDVDPEHWVGIKGVARVIRQGGSAVQDIQDLARRYDGNPDEFRGQQRITFLVAIGSSFEYGA